MEPDTSEGAQDAVRLEPCGRWGRRAKFNAKVGSIPDMVLIRRVRKFYPGQRIELCSVRDVEGMSTGCTPRWRTGRITEIREVIGYLFIDLI